MVSQIRLIKGSLDIFIFITRIFLLGGVSFSREKEKVEAKHKPWFLGLFSYSEYTCLDLLWLV